MFTLRVVQGGGRGAMINGATGMLSAVWARPQLCLLNRWDVLLIAVCTVFPLGGRFWAWMHFMYREERAEGDRSLRLRPVLTRLTVTGEAATRVELIQTVFAWWRHYPNDFQGPNEAGSMKNSSHRFMFFNQPILFSVAFVSVSVFNGVHRVLNSELNVR